MNMSYLQLTNIIEKMMAKDKDYRYMATSDLLNELNKGLKIDAELEVKLVSIIIQQLDDGSSDVSSLALKCLGPLVNLVGEARVLEMSKMLCQKLLNVKDHHRDVACTALRTIVSEVNAPYLAHNLISSLFPSLLEGITNQDTCVEIKCDCLDVFCEVLHKFAVTLTQDHECFLRALLPQLDCNNASVRKKTVLCIGYLSSSMSDDLLAKATLEVVNNLRNKGDKAEISRTKIQMLGALSHAVGYRFGPCLGEIVPVLINYCKTASEQDEELREYSLQALESFLLKCPKDISPFCGEILHLSIEYISYDPNLTDNMEEDWEDEVQEEGHDDSANEYTDDEDVAWKVRKAAAKCLAALIVSRPEMLYKLYEEACPRLIDRFKEREENVKIDIFNTFIELLHQTRNVVRGQTECKQFSPKWLLKQEALKIVKSLSKQLNEKSLKTKVAAFSVLKELIICLPDCIPDHIPALIPGIVKALSEKSSTSNLKIEALTFTRLTLTYHSPGVLSPYIKDLFGVVLSAVDERYYKVAAEALRVCGELARVMSSVIETADINFKLYVLPMYCKIMSRLTNQDQDQEVKECAISCMGLVISLYGHCLGDVLPSCLPVLLDRMGNEITRLTAVKAFAVIAASPIKVDLSCILENVTAQLITFLRKADRSLRQTTLGTLNSIIVAYANQIGPSAFKSITLEVSAMISDGDLHMAALALELCCTMVANCKSTPEVGLAIRSNVLLQSLTLLTSPLLQDHTLKALQNFFLCMISSSIACFDELLETLILYANTAGIANQSLSSIAQSISVLCLNAGDDTCSLTVKRFSNMLGDSATDIARKHLCLLCLGEIGRSKDLSWHSNIENIVIQSFESPFEEIKSAASYSLGNIALGNLPKFLPFILHQIDCQQNKQYLLLHSLKELIVRQSLLESEFQDCSIEKILELLFKYCESEEEGVRNVIAECLGKMALMVPSKLVPALKDRSASSMSFTRATAVTAIKYSTLEGPEKIDALLQPYISSFLSLINDADRHVRRAAVLALSTFALNKPTLVKGLLPELLPLLYDQTIAKKDLIRTVDLGPFKHVVDDGLELRKAAFECVGTLLDTCLDQINSSAFIVPYLKQGLEDHYDVKMPCHLILIKLADSSPAAVLADLDSLVDPLQKTVYFKPKSDAVKQEFDRNEDMIRSALRAIAALNRISGYERNTKFKNLLREMQASATLWDKYLAIRSE